MQPPHHDHHPWNDDRLGTLLRQGMPRSWRTATPSPEVWQRIACEISPCPPPARSRWAGWLRPGAGRPRLGGGPRWVSFSSSALVLSSALVVGVLMIGDISVLRPRGDGNACLGPITAGCSAGASGRQAMPPLSAPEQPGIASGAAPASSGAGTRGPRIAGAPPRFRVARVDPVALMDPVALVQPLESMTARSGWTFRFAGFEVAPGDKRARQSGEETQASLLFGGRRTAPPACPAHGQLSEAGLTGACIY